jgi:S1-C subfamily serine protease
MDKIFKLWLFAICIACLSGIFHQPILSGSELSLEEQVSQVKKATVKIYTVSNSPDYSNPWRMLEMSSGSGSGAIIEGNRILTCAHVVSDHTFIQVQRYGRVKRYNASVVSVSHEADLAILTVGDEEFFSDIASLEIGVLPKSQQEVLVYGYPAGGDTLSTTQGIISRVEHQRYVHSSLYLLAGQIDAAINPGNSGGPVIVDSKIVGVAMQGIDDLENAGYMVPPPVIKHFLKDLEDGKHDGIPDVGVLAQEMENPDIKSKFKMPQSRTGILIYNVLPKSPAKGILENDDILLSINGHLIADDGTVEFRPMERTYYSYYIEILQMGEVIDVEYLRQGEIHVASIKLNQRSEAFSLVPHEQYDCLPRYYIYGGIVFSPLTKNLMQSFVDGDYVVPEDLLVEYYSWPSEKRNEVVVVVQVLADDVNVGYHDNSYWIIKNVNGKEIKNFNEFYNLVSGFNGTYMTFKDKEGFQIVIDHKKAQESHETILKNYHITKTSFLGSGILRQKSY